MRFRSGVDSFGSRGIYDLPHPKPYFDSAARSGSNSRGRQILRDLKTAAYQAEPKARGSLNRRRRSGLNVDYFVIEKGEYYANCCSKTVKVCQEHT